MAIVRDADSGRVRGILRGADARRSGEIVRDMLDVDLAGAGVDVAGATRGLQVIFSRRAPAALEWR